MLQTPKHGFYTYDEEIMTTSNYLNNRSTFSKEPFVELCLRSRKSLSRRK